MSHTIESVTVLVLEALEKEWQREPEIQKCRTAAIVLSEAMETHNLTNDAVNRAIEFMDAPEREYLTIRERPDGQAMLPSDRGLKMLAIVELARTEERDKKKWSRGDKLKLASFLLSVLTFFAGLRVGEQVSKKSESKQILPQSTNAIPAASPKLP